MDDVNKQSLKDSQKFVDEVGKSISKLLPVFTEASSNHKTVGFSSEGIALLRSKDGEKLAREVSEQILPKLENT